MATKVFHIAKVGQSYKSAHDKTLNLLGATKDEYFWFRVDMGLSYLNEQIEGINYPDEVRQDVIGNSDFWNEFHNEWFRRECNLHRRLEAHQGNLLRYTEEKDGRYDQLMFAPGEEFKEFLYDFHYLFIFEGLKSDDHVIKKLARLR